LRWSLLLPIFFMLVSLHALAGVQVIASRVEVGAPWNALTGSRSLYLASLDSDRGILILEKFDTNTHLTPRTSLWRREYHLQTPEQVAFATTQMRSIDFEWPLETYYRLHARDCHALFFAIPTEPIIQLAGQAREIVSRLEGETEDYSIKRLIKIKAKCGVPAFYLGAVLSTDHRLKRFAIVSENGQPLPLRVVQENGQLLIKNNNTTIVSISGHSDFNQTAGGRFTASVISDCALGTYKTYDFEVSRRLQNGRYIWSLLSFHELDGHISLAGDRDPEFNVGEAITRAPVELVEGVLDGVFGTLIWNIFVSGNRKREMVENSIYEEAKKNQSLTDTFSDQELRAIAHRIAGNTGLRWFAPFTGQDNIKKRASMEFSYALVKKVALAQLPQGSNPDMANGVALHVTRDLERCLRAAQNSNGIDICVAKFSRSAPYRVGRELLELHMQAGLRGQSLTQTQKRQVLNTALLRFDQCSQSNYFGPYDDNIRTLAARRRSQQARGASARTHQIRRGFIDDEVPFDSNRVIMSCLFQGVMDGVDLATVITIDDVLAPMIPSHSERITRREILLAEMRQCLMGERYFSSAENFRQYNHTLLQSLEVEQFQQKLDACLAPTKIKAGEVVIQNEVANNPALLEATRDDPQLRQSVVQTTLTQGYAPCLARQSGVADPARCQTMVENVATRESFIIILQNTLATDMGRDTPAYNFALREIGLGTMEPRPYSYDLRKCFDDRREQLLTSLAQGQVLPSDDFSNANCITRAIMELAPAMVKHKYIQTLNASESLKGVQALRNDAFIREMGQSMKQCLLHELRSYNTVAGLTGALDGAQSRCTVALYQNILPRVIEIAMENKLKDIVPDEARRRILVASLKADFIRRIQGFDSEEAIMAQVDVFTADATIEIVRQSIRFSVEDNLPGNTQAQAVITQQIISSVVTPEWEAQMRTAITNNNAATQLRLQSQVKKGAGPLIMQHALPERLREHVPSASARNSITQGVVREYTRCLGRIRDNATDFDHQFDRCATRATNQATHAIFEVSLNVALNQYFPVHGRSAAEISGNRAAWRQVKSRLLVNSLWTDIAHANASGPRAVARLGEIFKVRAAREVAMILVERELYHSLTGPVRDRVVPHAKANARSCFQAIEEKLNRHEAINVEREIDKCSQKIKVETALMALMESFESNLGFLATQTARTAPVLASTRAFFNSCTSGYSSWGESQMEERLNACISRTVIHFSKNLGQATVDYMAPIRSGPIRAMPAFQTCLSATEAQAGRGVSWVKSEVERCATTILKPNLLMEVRHFYNSTIPSGLTGGQRAVVEDGFTLLAPAFDGKITSAGSGSASDPVTSLHDTFGQLTRFLADSARFDQVETQRRLTAFKVQIRRRTTGNSTMTDKQFMDAMVDSDLMTTMIEAAIAEKIIAKADEYGLGGAARTRVVSPENMRDIFERNARGRAVMAAIKREIVKPMLAGTPMNVIMTRVLSSVVVEVNRRIDDIKRDLLTW